MKLNVLNAETSYVIDPVAGHFASADHTALIDKFSKSPRRRHRYCYHQNPGVDLHDIFICYDSNSYIPVNKHIGKVESLTLVKGDIEVFLFNDSGSPTHRYLLSAADERFPFYIRIPSNTWHGLRALGSEPVIIKETISGPYSKDSLAWADFCPPELERKAGFRWYEELSNTTSLVTSDFSDFVKISDEVFAPQCQIVTLKRDYFNILKQAAALSPNHRARICCHIDLTDRLQEMLIVLSNQVCIPESYHIRKDESLLVLEGEGVYIFPNEDGSERLSISLGDSLDRDVSASVNFCRINRYIPHVITVKSEYLVFMEYTSGPFLKSDTDFRITRMGNT